MPKQIKLSDVVAAELEKRAQEDNLSLAGEVAKLLATSQLPPSPVDTSYFDKKFDDLKSLISDTAVDRVAAEGSADTRRAPGGKEWVAWDQMQYIIFTHDDDNPAWIIPEASVFQFKNGDPTAYAYFVKDNVIFMESMGRPEPLIRVTPEIREAIDKHFTYDD